MVAMMKQKSLAIRKSVFFAASLLLVFIYTTHAVAESQTRQEPIITEDLCGLLAALGPGDRAAEVTLAGIWQYNMGNLYYPSTRECSLDLEPATRVEFSSKVVDQQSRLFEQLIELGETDIRARLTATGTLWGPKQIGHDDERLPVTVAYANRTSEFRYDSHRTKFVVDKIVSVQHLPEGRDDPGVKHSRPTVPSDSLDVLDAGFPRYPKLARHSGIEGKVIIQAHVLGGKVHKAEALSGDRMLIEGEEGVLALMKTWRFPKHVDRIITTVFVYRLEHRPREQLHRLEVDFDLPHRVTIVGSANGW